MWSLASARPAQSNQIDEQERYLFVPRLRADIGDHGGEVKTSHLQQIVRPELRIVGVERFMLWFEITSIIP